MKIKPQNIEVETAGRNIEKLKSLPMTDTTIYAISNERNIIRLASQIEHRLEAFSRDFGEMQKKFITDGEVTIYNIVNDLPELKAEIRGHKEARNFYADLLKGE